MAAARRALASLLHPGGHRRLEDGEFDGAAAVDQERLTGVQLADLVGINPWAVGHVDAGLPGRPPGVQLPGLLRHPHRARELHERVGVGALMQD